MPLSEDRMIKTLLQEQPRLLAFLNAIVRRVDLSDDIFQDISLRAVRARAKLDNEEHFIRWLYRAARNRAIDEMRRSKMPLIDGRVLDHFESDWADQSISEFNEQSEALRFCIESLKPDCRQLIRFRYRDELSGKNIALRLSTTPEAIYMKLSRIRKQLRECITWRMQQGEAKGAGDGIV